MRRVASYFLFSFGLHFPQMDTETAAFVIDKYRDDRNAKKYGETSCNKQQFFQEA